MFGHNRARRLGKRWNERGTVSRKIQLADTIGDVLGYDHAGDDQVLDRDPAKIRQHAVGIRQVVDNARTVHDVVA